MKNVLIINGHQYYDMVAKGELTQSVISRMHEYLGAQGFEVKHTHIDKGYDREEEVQKLVWVNYIIMQYPVYWMSLPWITKKYFDEVLTQGVHYESDGRSRQDPSKTYGSGGLLQSKKYMLSLTYNCPESEFDNKEGFFEGLSMDQANFAVHKIFQFCALEPMESFSIHDIFKGDMDLEAELKRLEETLKRNFV